MPSVEKQKEEVGIKYNLQFHEDLQCISCNKENKTSAVWGEYL